MKFSIAMLSLLKSKMIQTKRIFLLLPLLAFFTVSVWGEVVEIPDPNLRAALEKTLGKNEGDAITKEDLATVTTLIVLPSNKIGSLQGLQYCTSLSKLEIHNSSATDLSPIKGLVNLTDLGMYATDNSESRIDDLTFVKDLTNLTRLALSKHHIQDLSPLMKLTSLTTLALSSNRVKDLEPLSVLTNLDFLHLHHNYIGDLSPLKDLKKLSYLYLGNNKVQDIASLEGLVGLTNLSIVDNRITDISPLSNLTFLRRLDLYNNLITDISPLLAEGGISNTIDLSGNPLSNESIVTHIPALIASGIKVEFNIPEDLAKQIEENKKAGVVNIPDPNLRATLEKELGKNEGDAITKEDLATITTINWWESSTNVAAIESIEGLQFCKSLTFFNLNGSVLLTDLSPIKNITTLKELHHNDRSYIDDLSVLSQLTSLTSLSLKLSDKGTDLSPLNDLTNLEVLDLRNNRIEDLSFLQNLTNLETLYLNDNRIEDLAPLQNLINLETLELSNNRIQDLTPIQKLTNLSALFIQDNRITDISFLSNLTTLKSLRLANNRIIDISPLLKGGGISNSINLRYNPLNEISLTSHLPALILAGVDVSYNADIDKLVADYKPGKFANQTKGSFKLQLPKGLNMISIPVKTATLITAKSLAQQLNATLVIRLDADNQEFVGYVPDHLEATNFDISGGMGVIVNLLEEEEVTFTGQVWDNVSAAPTAKPLDSSVWAFSVVFDHAHASKINAPVLIQNISLPHSQPYKTTMVTGSQKGMAIVVDHAHNAVVNVGDIIQIQMGDQRWRYRLSPQDLDNAFAKLELTEDLRLPNQTTLLQNYPNPFNPETWIPFHLAQDSQVKIQVYSIDGRQIRSMDMGMMLAGKYIDRQSAVYWNGRTDVGEQVSSGIYYLQLLANDISDMRRMVILK